MNRAIHINRSDDRFVDRLIGIAFPNERTKRLRIRPTQKVTLDGMYWDGGSRSEYVAIDLDSMQVIDLSSRPGWSNPPQFGGPNQPPVVPLVDANEGIVIVERQCFGGKFSLTIYVNPNRMPALPAPTEDLSDNERIVLYITRSLIAAARIEEADRRGMNRTEYETAKNSLIEKGYLNKRGAITNKGRNAL